MGSPTKLVSTKFSVTHVTLSQSLDPSGPWFAHLPNGEIGRGAHEGPTCLSVSVFCEPRCPRQRLLSPPLGCVTEGCGWLGTSSPSLD